MTMALAGAGVPEGYAEGMKQYANRWSCCGAFASLDDDGSLPSASKDGCRESNTHKVDVKFLVVASQNWSKNEAECRAALAAAGAVVEFVSFDDFSVEHALGYDAVSFVSEVSEAEHVAEYSEALNNADPDMVQVIFSDPDRIDGWRLQALASGELTPAQFSQTLISTFRHSATPSAPESFACFISYTRRSAEVMERFNRNFGAKVWVDIERLSPGVDWSNEIVDGIKGSYRFLLLLTPEMPEQTYCWRELRMARKEGKLVIVATRHDLVHRFFDADGSCEADFTPLYLPPTEWNPQDSLDGRVVDSYTMVLVDNVETPKTIIFSTKPEESWVTAYHIGKRLDKLDAHLAFARERTSRLMKARDWRAAETSISRDVGDARLRPFFRKVQHIVHEATDEFGAFAKYLFFPIHVWFIFIVLALLLLARCGAFG